MTVWTSVWLWPGHLDKLQRRNRVCVDLRRHIVCLCVPGTISASNLTGQQFPVSAIFPPTHRPKTFRDLQSRLHKKSTAERSDKLDPLKLRLTTVCFTWVCWTGCPGNRVWFHYGMDKHNQRVYPPSIAREKTPAMMDLISCTISGVCVSLSMRVLVRHEEIENSAPH